MNDLNDYLQDIRYTISEEIYVFVTLPEWSIPTTIRPLMSFMEVEGYTFILKKSDAMKNEIPFIFESKLLSLETKTPLELVGFIANVAKVLSDAGVSTNIVAGYYHDHILIALDKVYDTVVALDSMQTSEVY